MASRCVYDNQSNSFQGYCGLCGDSGKEAVECQYYQEGMCGDNSLDYIIEYPVSFYEDADYR